MTRQNAIRIFRDVLVGKSETKYATFFETIQGWSVHEYPEIPRLPEHGRKAGVFSVEPTVGIRKCTLEYAERIFNSFWDGATLIWDLEDMNLVIDFKIPTVKLKEVTP